VGGVHLGFHGFEQLFLVAKVVISEAAAILRMVTPSKPCLANSLVEISRIRWRELAGLSSFFLTDGFLMLCLSCGAGRRVPWIRPKGATAIASLRQGRIIRVSRTLAQLGHAVVDNAV
jgi:hypothetical protein